MLVSAKVFGIHEAYVVIVSGEHTKCRLVKLYGISPNKVKVVYHGMNMEEDLSVIEI